MTFRESLRTKDFVLAGHLNLAKVTNSDSLIRQAEALSASVDAVHIADNASMQPQISGLAAAAMLIPRNIDPIVHFACRDRNRIALQKDIFGAAALGVTSVMVMRGKSVPKDKYPAVRNVFDTPAKELLSFINNLRNEDVPLIPPEFLAGINAVIFDPDDDWTPRNLEQKCDAGADFIQLQLCFDTDALRNYMAKLVASKITRRATFLTALAPLPSAEAAITLRDNIKGALIPDSIIERLKSASDPEREGIEICAEMLQELASIPGVSGASLLTLGGPEMIASAIDASGIRS